MNRVIKFRCWDGIRKIWHEFTIGNLLKGSIGQYGVDSISADWDKIYQFTGLTDKNGKEIYEGDIVEHEKRIHTIVFSRCGFTIANKKGLYPASLQYLPVFADKIEVIGNIYENPELLAPKDNIK